jgi:HEAT repeat protein
MARHVLLVAVLVFAAASAAQPKADDADVPLLLRLLRAENVNTRLFAIDELEALGDKAKPAVPALANALADPDATVRLRAARALWRIHGSDAGVLLLTETLKSRNPREVQQAMAILVEVGRAAVPAVIARTSDENRLVRVAAYRTLARMGPSNQAAVLAIREGLRSARHDIFEAAFDAMRSEAGCSALARRELLELVRSGNAEVEELAASALHEAGEDRDRILSALFRHMVDLDPKIRAEAWRRLYSPSEHVAPLLVFRRGRYEQTVRPPERALRAVLEQLPTRQLADLVSRLRRDGDEGMIRAAAILTASDRTDGGAAVFDALLEASIGNDLDAADKAAEMLKRLNRTPEELAYAFARVVQTDSDQLWRSHRILLDYVRTPAGIHIVLAAFLQCGGAEGRHIACRYVDDHPALAKTFAPMLAMCLAEESEWTRVYAARIMLRENKDPLALATLITLLHEVYPEQVRFIAAEALGGAGPKAAEAVPELIKLYQYGKTKNLPFLKDAAASALHKIDPAEAKKLQEK